MHKKYTILIMVLCVFALLQTVGADVWKDLEQWKLSQDDSIPNAVEEEIQKTAPGKYSTIEKKLITVLKSGMHNYNRRGSHFYRNPYHFKLFDY